MAIPALIALLKHEDATIRIRAVSALERVGAGKQIYLAGLIEGLVDRDIYNRNRACAILQRVGPAAREAIPALVQGILIRGDTVDESARDALVALGDPAIRHLAALLPDAGDSMRIRILTILCSFGAGPGIERPEIKALLDSENPRIARLAAVVISGRIPPDSLPGE